MTNAGAEIIKLITLENATYLAHLLPTKEVLYVFNAPQAALGALMKPRALFALKGTSLITQEFVFVEKEKLYSKDSASTSARKTLSLITLIKDANNALSNARHATLPIDALLVKLDLELIPLTKDANQVII